MRREYATGVIEIAGQLDDYTKTGAVSSYFNRSNYLTAPSNSAFAFGTGDFTIECWIYPSTLGITTNGINYFIDNRAAANSGEWTFGTNTAGDLIFANGASGDFSLSASAAITLNNWQHVAVVRSGTTFTLYRNGVQIATTTNSQNFSTVSALAISSNPTNAYYFNGYISNVRITKGVAVYTGAFTTPTSPLRTTQVAGTNIAAITSVSSVSLLTCQDLGLTDKSNNALVITNTGVTTTIKTTPF
jgi:hypothetical protein